MPRPKRTVLQTAAATSTPPDTLPPTHTIARVLNAAGNNLFRVETPAAQQLLVELPARFRSEFWIKRGGFVVVDTAALADRANKLGGEIVNVVREEKRWRKMEYWPAGFGKGREEDGGDVEGGEGTRMGMMPPEDGDGEDDEERG